MLSLVEVVIQVAVVVATMEMSSHRYIHMHQLLDENSGKQGQLSLLSRYK